MRKEFKIAKLLKIASIIYSISTVMFFLLTNLAAGFVAEGKTGGIYGSCILVVNLMVYLELLGYFVIVGILFLYIFRKSQFARMHQPMPPEEKFPTIPFIIGLLCFLVFMSLMNAVLV